MDPKGGGGSNPSVHWTLNVRISNFDSHLRQVGNPGLLKFMIIPNSYALYALYTFGMTLKRASQSYIFIGL